VSFDERGFAITYAERGREGRTVVVDGTTLATRGAEAYTYDDVHPHEPPYTSASRVALDVGGARLVAWNDDVAGQVLVEADGRGRSLVSPADAVVVGAPQGASDGRRAVIAFFACDGDAFSLVAVAIEP
jgi:hypothetical protein